MTEYIVRFLVGGAVVRPSRCSATSCVQRALRAFRCGALRGARHAWRRGLGARRGLRSPTEPAGAIALAFYSIVGCHLLIRARLRALPPTMLSLAAWLPVAFLLLAIAGART
jgi:hypothetical protein